MASGWIRNPSYDLTFVMGGALLTLGVAGAVALQPALLPILFWVWIIGFEGSHFWATFSRTYIDKDFRAKNPGVLLGSLVFFALPVLALAMDSRQADHRYADGYGFFIFLWSLYHNARQHYGFASIYGKKARLEPTLVGAATLVLYLSVAAPQLHFVLVHRAGVSYPIFREWFASGSSLGALAHWGPLFVSAFALLYLGRIFLEARSRGNGLVPFLYVLVCWTFYSTMFYLVAPREPFFAQHANNAQLFMLIAIMNSLFHNIQYHAIVWHYGTRRYGTPDSREREFGLARLVNGNAFAYVAVALFFGAVFGAIVSASGDWPSWTGSFQSVPFNAWAYCLYFGIVGHHFYLDQKIWRPSRQVELRSYLDVDDKSLVRAS